MLAQMSRIIAEIFVFADLHLYCAKPDSPLVGLFEDGGLFVGGA